MTATTFEKTINHRDSTPHTVNSFYLLSSVTVACFLNMQPTQAERFPACISANAPLSTLHRNQLCVPTYRICTSISLKRIFSPSKKREKIPNSIIFNF